jgi:prolyl oligopeptidase
VNYILIGSFLIAFFFNSLDACALCQKDSKKLQNLFDQYYAFVMEETPELATIVGYSGFDHLWTDGSISHIAQRNQRLIELYDETLLIDDQWLTEDEKLNFEVLKNLLKDMVAWTAFKREYLPLSKMDGFHLTAQQLFEAVHPESEEDFKNLLIRLDKLPEVIEQTIELSKKGMEEKILPPKVIMEEVPQQLVAFIPETVEKSPLFFPFLKANGEFQQKAKELLQQKVFPAFARYRAFLLETYIPQCRESISISEIPHGEELYLQCVKSFTTTDLHPLKIHQMGVEEVARIKQEIGNIQREVGFEGTLDDFFDFLKTSPEFYFSNKSDMLEGFEELLIQIEERLPILFGRLPKIPCEVVAIASSVQDQAVGAYYVAGSIKAKRPGRFFVNTSKLGSRPKWGMTALALHEALPGHHMQISIALENDKLPRFRSISNFTAYVEGWGLYSEGLGDILGVYQDPYSRFGRLSLEMLRAVRLVVDTGIHFLGWSRQKTIQYMLEHTGMPLGEVEIEVDRYIAWPGQALAYKIGERKILEMRQLASSTLKEKFDIRDFHDEVLEHGSLPLTVFESNMKQWIETQLKF